MSEDILQSEINKIIRSRLLEEQKAEKREEFRKRRERSESSAPPELHVPPDWSDKEVPLDENNLHIPLREAEQHRTIIERDLVRRMLRFGSVSFKPQAEGEEEPVALPFAHYVIEYMQGLNFEVKDELLAKVYNVFIECHELERVPELDAFMKHPDPEIQSFVVGSVVDKYEVSKRWEEVHQIYSTREEDLLNKALMDSLHLLKLNDNRQEIQGVQEQLTALSKAIEKGEESALAGMRELLIKRKELDEQRRKITSYFGTAILP